jgi:hypothetical protein
VSIPAVEAAPGKAGSGGEGLLTGSRSVRSAEIGTDPETGEELEKILIELPPDHWSGTGGERVWAKRVGEDQFQIRNTPWYAYDMNWGDVVACEGLSPADLPIVANLVSTSGHRTLRVWFDESVTPADRDAALERFNELDAWYENADDQLYVLDLEPDVDAAPILDYLAVAEELGTLHWETGWS